MKTIEQTKVCHLEASSQVGYSRTGALCCFASAGEDITSDTAGVTCKSCNNTARRVSLREKSFDAAGLLRHDIESRLDAETLWDRFEDSKLWPNPNGFWSRTRPLISENWQQKEEIRKIEALVPERFKAYVERKRKRSLKLLGKVNTIVMHAYDPEHYKATVERYARMHKLLRVADRKLIVRKLDDAAIYRLYSPGWVERNGGVGIGVQDCWELAKCDRNIVFSYRDAYDEDMVAFVESAVYFLYREKGERQ
jgi:hypothetical protein